MKKSSSRGDGEGESSGSRIPQRLTLNDAVGYLNAVKDVFQDDEKEKFDELLDVLIDFNAKRIDRPGVIGRAKELLKGHKDLILGLNTFLPEGCEITLEASSELKDEAEEEELLQAEAVSFVVKIKTRFQGSDVFRYFLDILDMYRKETKSLTEVYRDVAALFGDHMDLLQEFTRYVPNPHHNSPTSSTCAPNSPYFLDRSSASDAMPPTERQMHGDLHPGVDNSDLDSRT